MHSAKMCVFRSFMLTEQKRPTDRQGEEEPPFLLPTPPLPRLPSVPIRTNPQWRPRISTDVIDNMLPVFRSAHQSEIQGGGREDIQETCPKETRKGQWSTTKCISSICYVRQDVANASFSLPLRGEQEKGCTRGKSLEMFMVL